MAVRPRSILKHIGRYLIPFAAVALVWLFHLGTGSLFQPTPFALYTLAVLFSAWLGGLGPGLLATVVVGLAAEATVAPGGAWIDMLRPPEVYRVITYLLVGAVITVLTKSLRTTRGHLATYIESMSDGFYSFDREWRYVYVNANGARFFSLEPRVMIGKTIFEVFPDARGSEGFQRMEQCVREQTPCTFELHSPQAGRWLDVAVYPNEEGATCFARDITDRKHASESQRESEERLRLAMDAGRVGAWDWDLVNDKIAWSERTYELYGLPAGAFAGTPEAQHEFVHAEDRARVSEATRQSMEEGAPFDLEFRIVQPGGRVRWIATTARVLRDPQRTPVRMLGVVRDVTDTKQSEEERERLLASERSARAEAERANRMKDEFLATLSHELRTPLQAIVGWSRLLRSERLDADRTRQAVETVERNALAQSQLIEDLLDMNRIVTGKIRVEAQPVELGAVVDAALETVRPAAEGKQIRLVRGSEDAVVVHGDPQRLQQVVWNLLTNAIKFTPKAGAVTVSVARQGAEVELTVADTGRGIAAEFLPLVFDRFRQADSSTTRQSGGLGLGLAIVRHLVELHGGSVAVASEGLDRGATFTVRLPVVAMAAPRPSVAVRDVPAATNGASLQGVRVLLVEDDADSRELIRRVLEDGGAKLAQVTSVAEALSQLDREVPQVLISDIGLPGEDGYELIRRVRELPPERGGRVPAIALTAFARSEDRTRALLSGYQVHVAKPVEPGELVAIVQRLAHGDGRRKEER